MTHDSATNADVRTDIRYEHRGVLDIPFAHTAGLTQAVLEPSFDAAAAAAALLAGEDPHPLLVEDGVRMTAWKQLPGRYLRDGSTG